MSDQPCAICGRPGTRLCDFVLLFGQERAADEVHTCDLPMCDEHAHEELVWRWHGSEGGGCETVDKCGYHAGHPNLDRGRADNVELERKAARRWAQQQALLRVEHGRLRSGARYRHFKGGLYTVVAVATDAEQGGQLVVYTDGAEVWSRPLARFLDAVAGPDGRTVPRFEFIGSRRPGHGDIEHGQLTTTEAADAGE